jgi:hypothetical protein
MKRNREPSLKAAICSVLPSATDQMPLLLKTAEARKYLGNVSARTLARLEQRGLIKSLPILRHKMYASEELRRFVANAQNWNANEKGGK